jgi:hypothetical protein
MWTSMSVVRYARVVAMKSHNPEGNLKQHRLEYENQMLFADGFRAAHHCHCVTVLPLMP